MNDEELLIDHVQGDIDTQEREYKTAKSRIHELLEYIETHDCTLAREDFCPCVDAEEELELLQKDYELYYNDFEEANHGRRFI